VAAIENLTHPSQIERYLVYFSRFHLHLLLETVTVPRTADRIDNQNRTTIGIDVGNADDEIGIFGR